jgi:hypothetical protein
MTARFLLGIASRQRWPLVLAGVFAIGFVACSSDSSGLRIGDASLDGRVDMVIRLDGSARAEAGPSGAGGAAIRRDAPAVETGTVPRGSGGAFGIDGAVGGAGGTGALGTGGIGRGGTGGTMAAGGAVGGRGGSSRGSGGAAGSRTGGASAAGGAAGGTGGTLVRDAAPASDSAMDRPLSADAPVDGAMARRDAWSGRPDTAPALDGAVLCGYLDEPCCEQRTCSLPSLVCTGGGGGDGTCVVCGGEDEPCCEGDVCTEPNTVCVGGGRGAGSCRVQ